MLRANLLGIPLFLVMMAAAVAPYIGAHGMAAFAFGVRAFVELPVLLSAIVAGTLAHEGLHALGWMVAGGGNFSSVKFGFYWKTLTPYAHFTRPITAKAYRVGIVLPGIVVGLLPAVAGYLVPEPSLILFGGFFLGGAAGDVMGLWAARNIPPAALVLDHPSRVGCILYAGEGDAPST